MQRIHYANPTCFSLPQEILLSVTECYERPLMNGLSVDNYSGTIGFRGRRRKKHDDFCYLCGVESQYGDADEDLVRCHRCSHSYHLWCLDPPLLSHPPNHLEWICPVHLNKTQDMCNQKRRGIKYLLPDETFRLDFSEKSRKQHLHTTIQQIVQNDLVTKAEQKEWLQDLLHFETELKRQVLELLHEEEDRPESAEQLQILSLVGENELDLIQNDPAFCPEDDDRAKEDEPPMARHTPSGTARVSLMPKHSPRAIYSFIQFLGMKQLMQWNQDLGQSGEIPLAFRDTLQEYRDQGWQRKAELYLPLVKLLKDLHDELKDDTLNEKKKKQQQKKKKREEAKTLPTQPDLLHNILAPLDQTNSDKAVSTQHVLVDDKTRRQSRKTNLHEQTAEEAQTEITRCTSASTGNNAATSSTNEAATTTNNQALPEAKPTTNTRKRKGHQDATNQEGHEPTTVAGPHHKRTKTTSGTAAAPVKKTTLRKTTGASQSTQASPSTSSSPVTNLLTPPTTTNIKLTPNNSPTSNHTSTPASLSAQHLDGQVASSSDNQQTTPHTPTPTLPTALSRSPQTPRRGPYGAIEFQSQTHAEAVTIKMNQPKLLLGRYHEESPLVDPTAQFVDLTEYTNRPRVISRIHVTIEFDPQSDKYYVCSGGRNGTTLNGELLQQHKRVPLISGKCIGIADLSLRWKRFKRV
ncbi:PHD finger protein 12, variant 3 [Balamuthia mandrillaris]